MRASLATLLPVVALAAMAPAASADSFVDATPGTMAFAVPVGVTSLNLSATAGAGGDVTNGTTTLVTGGLGAVVTGTVAVSPGQQLQLTVASKGGNGLADTGTTGQAGTPDGGIGGWSAGGGGGATRVVSCQGVVCSVAVIAAGGGGAGMNGDVFLNPGFATVPGGPGGAAGAPGTDGAGDNGVGGGKGGQPGTAGGVGTGGAGGTGGSAGSFAGASGSNQMGGAGGHTGAFAAPEGGGGGGGGVFGGGGGGAGASGMNTLNQPTKAGGGGGAGGSSLAPSGGSVQTAAPGAVPRIVLTWTAPGGSDPTTQRTLTVIKSGSGAVSSSPAGIDCGATCAAAFDGGTSVTLTPTPATGSTFSGWSGGCSGTGSCQVTMGSDQTVAAAFTANPPGTPPNTKISKAKIDQATGSATFKFRAAGGSKAKATSGFQCALIKKRHAKPKFRDCKSPKKYRHLKPRKYTFEVRAFDPVGKDTTPAKKAFRIK